MAESSAELESFREQWRREVSARKADGGNHSPSTSRLLQSGPSNARRPAAPPRIASQKAAQPDDADEPETVHNLDGNYDIEEAEQAKPTTKPVSALEHYEQAVEREDAGKLGDSLDLYRKAFRVCST